MASTYPGSLDGFTNPTSGDNLNTSVGGRTHSQMHRDENDALEAVQAELGTDPSGAYSTVKDRINALDRNVFDAVKYGAVVDGSTNDTAAWQAAIDACAAAGGGVITSSKPGVSVISGALQDTSNANAQLLLPNVHMLDDPQMGIVIRGPWEQSSVSSVVGAADTPVTGLILKSTLASGTGAVIGAYGSGTSYQHFTFVNLALRDLTVRTIGNPTITGLDLRRVDTVTMDNVTVDTGQYDTTLSEPTSSGSYGIRLPGINNGAHIRLGRVDVFGFYNGIEFSEHAQFDSVAVGGCRTGLIALAANHASRINRVLVGYCKYGIRFTGAHYIDIAQYAVEHASSGWYQTTYDVDDASNYGHGLLRWSAVLQGSGQSATFTVNGASNLTTSRVGASLGSGGSLSVQDENGTAITSVTQLDFQGAGVTAASGSGEVVVTIPADNVYRDRLVAAGGEAILTLGATPVANSPLVWVNGTLKWPTTDYTITGGVITFGSALTAADVVAVQYHSTATSASASSLSAGAVNVVDNFTRADSTSTMGSTSTGSKAWANNAGTWGILSNTGYVASGSAGVVNRATVDAAVTACTLSVDITFSSGAYAPSGFVVRSDGSGNYYLVEVTMGSSVTPKIYKGVAGSNSVIATGAAISIPSGATITCEVSGSTITAKYLGSTIVTVTDSSYNANTRFGVYTQASGSGVGSMRFDNFSIQP